MIHKEVYLSCDKLSDSMDRVKNAIEGLLRTSEDENVMLQDVIGCLESFASILDNELTVLSRLNIDE